LQLSLFSPVFIRRIADGAAILTAVLRKIRGLFGMGHTVTLKKPGGRKFTQTMPDHLFGNINFKELSAVMDFKRMPHELGRNH
jgi:hypothetical protein